MKIIKLPRLERIIFHKKGCNNIIKQLIAPEFDLPLNIEEVSRSYVIINYIGTKYCLTCNKDTYPQDIAYVLLTNTRPTKEKLVSCSVCIKCWLKHPLLKEYSTKDVIQSWKNDFFF